MKISFLAGLLSVTLISVSLLHAQSDEFIQVIRLSQNHLAQAQPKEAEAVLVNWEQEHPECHADPLYCYQRFFVALEGSGDRKTARAMIQRMSLMVKNGSLSPQSPEYLSVTEAWGRSLFFATSDLPRLAHLIMTKRLASK